MTREPELALVLSADEWVDDLHRYCADHGGARVRCLVLDPTVALDEEFDVLVTSDRWPALTRPFVDALHERGRRVLVVGDPRDGVELAARLRVDGLVAPGTPLQDLLATIVGLTGPRVDLRAVGTVADPVATEVRRVDGAIPGVVIVGGPRGAGSTEVALALAGLSAGRGTRPVVVDADTVTPSVAVRLGLPLEPNLCTAVDAVAFGIGAVPGALFDLGTDWPVVLVGVPNRRAGSALGGADVAAVADALAQRFAPVVVDVSAGPGDGPDDLWSALVSRAEVVVGVASGDPVGVVRLGEWVEAARSRTPVPVLVVVNRAPVSRRRRAEIAADLQRDGRIAGLTFAPVDRKVEDAVWSASLVDRGPFVRAIDALRSSVVAGVGRRSGGGGVD